MSFLKDPLEKALFTLGSVVTAGVIAFSACTSSTPTSTPRLPKPTATAPAVRIQPTPEPIIKLEKSTPITITTPTPIPAPTYTPTPALPILPYSNLPFAATIIRTADCTRVVTMDKFNRELNSNRKGWDVVEGNLRWHFMPDCAKNKRSYEYKFTEYGPRDVITLGNIYEFKRKNGKTGEIDPWLNIVASWEQGGKVIIPPKEDKGSLIAASEFSYDLVPFKFDVPTLAKKLEFSIVFREGRSIEEGIAELEREVPSSELSKIEQVLRSIINGRILLSPPDSDVYKEWFHDQISPYFFGNVVNQTYLQNIVGKDIKVESELINSQNGLSLKVKLTNNSFTKDVPIVDSGFYIWHLTDENGKTVYNSDSYLPIGFLFDSEGDKLPPGYTVKSVLNIRSQSNPVKISYPNEHVDIPQNARYMVGAVWFGDYDIHNRKDVYKGQPLIVDLHSIGFFPTNKPPSPPAATPTPVR